MANRLRFLLNRYGAAIECGRTVISLGWNVWGWDAGDRYFIVHLWTPKIFCRLRGRADV
ncbi:hypothetical protein [Methylovirgula sp. HY1]|uniref:hypothetical protein n=1 Tax=Methylovirgula sp. HY1 TaxID=2822761 RepID=UPI001C5BC334|nr:hypothetical protein [Methylovirgula sp. HY1]QXX74272.1 hypothetical protein MHY1_01082 [Methylovirgula sp. HY1]